MGADMNDGSQSLVDISILENPANLGAVLPTLKSLNASLPTLTTGDDEARYEMLRMAWRLVLALETPRETMLRHCWAQSGVVAALNTGTVSGLWTAMAEKGDRPQSVHELAAATGIDATLLSRLLRHLAAMQYIDETGEDEYRPTNFTKAMAHAPIADSHIAMCSGTSAGPYEFHEFAQETSFQNPTDAYNTSMQRAYNTDKDMFQWLQSIGYGEHFNHHMGAYGQGRLPWMDPSLYPVRERLFAGASADPEAALLVDVGGSVGHDLARFRRQYPEHPGRLVLQDLAGVVGQIRALDPAIVRMAHDFHTPQPVRSARAYYLHSVLHDWPDAVCADILAHLTRAMAPGYSRLLINENVLPRTGAHWEMTALDMVMLTLFSAQERTEQDWQRLLEDNGLRIVKIWRGRKAWESLIECELAENDASLCGGSVSTESVAESVAESPVSTVYSMADSLVGSARGDSVESPVEVTATSAARDEAEVKEESVVEKKAESITEKKDSVAAENVQNSVEQVASRNPELTVEEYLALNY